MHLPDDHRNSDDINGDGENLLPRDTFGPSLEASFVAGDSRSNDNIVLTSMHVLFMREHNRLVDELEAGHPTWSEEELYQRARKMVGAELQAITYNEFLPALLGPHRPSPTGHYDPELDPTVINEFATVFLRIGHSMLTADFKRVQNDGQPDEVGAVPLEDAFFNPSLLATTDDLDLFLKELALETQEETDLKLVRAMRFALLGAIDIQRARDHGLPDYNTMREAYGLPRVTSFEEITPNNTVQQALQSLYADVDSIDPFVGALIEDHLPGASVGPLVAAGFETQFVRLRDGDRFWYENDDAFSPEDVDLLRQTTLADIIQRNTGITSIQANVFFVPILGDVNSDGFVNCLDITPFINAQSAEGDEEAFLLLTLNGCFLCADANMDGAVDFLDITPYINLLDEVNAAAVPEPTALAVLAVLVLGPKRRQERRTRPLAGSRLRCAF